MKAVQKLEGLTRLDVRGTAVTVEGVKALRDLPKLGQLGLSKTGLTDADLEVFKDGFKAQHDLDVTGTKVTRKGLIELRKAKPGLEAWLPRP
jgi:hypothetical protein